MSSKKRQRTEDTKSTNKETQTYVDDFTDRIAQLLKQKKEIDNKKQQINKELDEIENKYHKEIEAFDIKWEPIKKAKKEFDKKILELIDDLHKLKYEHPAFNFGNPNENNPEEECVFTFGPQNN